MNVVPLFTPPYFLGKFLYYFLESILQDNSQEEKDVTGEIVLITGAASGLGRLLSIARLGAILRF